MKLNELTTLKNNFTHNIYLLFILTLSLNISSQEIKLKIISKIETNNKILAKINFKEKHKDSISVINEAKKISSYLKNLGYFTNSIDCIRKKENNYEIFFSLNKRIKTAFIKIDKKAKHLFKDFKIKKEIVSIPIKKLQSTLTKISLAFDKEGKSFSKALLKNLTLKGDSLFANLKIHQSKKRTINTIIVKGYKKFPESFLTNYYKIDKKTVFSKSKVKEISSLSKSLDFAEEIKPPEILFLKDSTILYLYLKKTINNSIDGIIGFSSKENGALLFNGNIDLNLNNILNEGETFNLFWNSIGNEKQEFKVLTRVPYILNSKITPEISFSIYKQDSTFLSTKFESKLFYQIKPKTNLGLTFNSESSENLKKKINSDVKTFSNYFLGLQFEYRVLKNDIFLNDKFYLKLNPSFGKRKTDQNSSNQFKVETNISYLWDLNLRNSIYLRNKFGYLNSNNLINNELFRIGGVNSIRGYNNQSIFTSSYTYFNIEYRYLTSKKSYLYSITDIGKTKEEKNKLFSFGIGYLFKTNNSQININTSIQKKQSTLNLNNTNLTISWKNTF